MNETKFTKGYMDHFERQTGAISFKIPDPRLAMGMGANTGTRFVDVVSCCRGIFLGMEWKLIPDSVKRGFRIDSVRDSQLKALDGINAAGGVGLLMFGMYKGPQDKTVFIVTPDQWREAVAATTKKSIRIVDVFADCATTMYKSGSWKHWDIKPIMERIDAAKQRF